jgi:hypothetical protein
MYRTFLKMANVIDVFLSGCVIPSFDCELWRLAEQTNDYYVTLGVLLFHSRCFLGLSTSLGLDGSVIPVIGNINGNLVKICLQLVFHF